AVVQPGGHDFHHHPAGPRLRHGQFADAQLRGRAASLYYYCFHNAFYNYGAKLRLFSQTQEFPPKKLFAEWKKVHIFAIRN
ncbi:MAG: hypothetical protein IJ844_07775, partial [Prevotella sp.]|nr:hypothetical protein [Prevotella sp.]